MQPGHDGREARPPSPWLRRLHPKLLLVLLPLLLVVGSSAASAPIAAPEIVIPGNWMSDKSKKFLFLPLAVPEAISLQQCKILSNGDSLLIVVTEQPQDEPEDDALRKYKLVLDALKSEVGHDEGLLREKLEDWLETEEDEEVRVRVQAAIDSLSDVRTAKKNTVPRTLSVPLGVSLVQLEADDSRKPNISHGLPASAALRTLVAQGGRGKRLRKQGSQVDGAALDARAKASHASESIIKESFTVEIPYPVAIEKIFAVQAAPGKLIVGMPWVKNSLEAQGVSTGGKPFARIPVFSAQGELLAGPGSAALNNLASGMDAGMFQATGTDTMLRVD